VQADEEVSPGFYANRVHVQVIDATEHYRVLTLVVNCGITKKWVEANPKESKELASRLRMSVPFIQDNILCLVSPDKTSVLYTINLSDVIPADWTSTVQRLTASMPSDMGLILADPDHLDETEEVHRLTNADCRPSGAEQCRIRSAMTYVYGGPIPCEREEGHRGLHQAFTEDGAYVWEHHNRVVLLRRNLFGFRNVCPQGGLVTAGSSNTHDKCSTCHYWLDQIHAGGGFVINGNLYRQSSGGAARVVNLILNSGRQWSGELVKVGKIPEWLQEMFRENAKFSDVYHW
jgi:hypothetical protein